MNRVKYLDVAKGITIILVIIGHCLPLYTTDLTDALFNFIYSFHMPLFFLISGYFYKPGKLDLGRKAKQLLLPYFIISAINLYWKCQRVPNVDINKNIIAILYGNSSDIRKKAFEFNFPIIGALWFLLALFFCFALYHLLWTVHQCYNIPLTFLVILTAAISIELNDLTWLPFSLQPAMASLVFFHAGNLFKQGNMFENPNNKPSKQALLLIGALWFLAFTYGTFRINENLYEGEILVFSGAIAGSYFFILFSKWLSRCSIIEVVLSFIGRNSLYILCVHALDNNFRNYIQKYISTITVLKSYKGLLLYIVLRVAVIMGVTLVFVAVKSGVEKGIKRIKK